MFLVRKRLLIPTISRLEPSMSLYDYTFLLCICQTAYKTCFTNTTSIMFSHLTLQLRVSSVMSNSPYILVLDCDMFCNDPTSARYAMCFHLDPKMSSSLSFVQFPQKFHNISKNDIYDSQLRSLFSVRTKDI